MSYDKSLSIFSPNGTLSQVDYAYEAVKKGGLSIGIVANKCVILAAERKAVPKLQDPRTIKKINKVDNHVFISYAGIIADSRSLIDYARLECQSYRYALDTNPSIEYLAKQIAFRQQDYTQRSGVRPFGISCLIAGVDEDKRPKLYLSEPSGALAAWKATAIGKNSDKVVELLEASYEDEMEEERALSLVIDCMLQYVEAGSKNIEVALMRVGEPLLIVEDERVDKIIAVLEEKKKKEEKKPADK